MADPSFSPGSSAALLSGAVSYGCQSGRPRAASFPLPRQGSGSRPPLHPQDRDIPHQHHYRAGWRCSEQSFRLQAEHANLGMLFRSLSISHINLRTIEPTAITALVSHSSARLYLSCGRDVGANRRQRCATVTSAFGTAQPNAAPSATEDLASSGTTPARPHFVQRSALTASRPAGRTTADG